MVAKTIHGESNVVPMEFHSILNEIENLMKDQKADYF